MFEALPELRGSSSLAPVQAKTGQSIGFVKLVAPAEEMREGSITIQLHGVQITVEHGADIRLLEQVLQAVQRTC